MPAREEIAALVCVIHRLEGCEHVALCHSCNTFSCCRSQDASLNEKVKESTESFRIALSEAFIIRLSCVGEELVKPFILRVRGIIRIGKVFLRPGWPGLFGVGVGVCDFLSASQLG